MNKKVIMISVPLLAAAAVGVTAVAGLTVNKGVEKSAHPQKVSTANSPVVAQAVIGDPDDPATWKLPIEAYMATPQQEKSVFNAHADLMESCMHAAGYSDWKPAPPLPVMGGKTLVDWRYGIHDAELAAKNGYHPDAIEVAAYNTAMSEGAVDKSGAPDSTVDSCSDTAAKNVPASAVSQAAQKIGGDSYKSSLKDPSVVAVFAKWSSCMKAKGYDYKDPMAANDDPRFGEESVITDLEKATASADVDCKNRLGVEKIWFDAESSIQLQAIASQRSALASAKAKIDSSATRASAVTSAQ